MPSLRFLAYLAHRVEGLRVALLLAARPGEECAAAQELIESLAVEPDAVLLRPRPLGRSAVRSLVTQALGARVGGRQPHACADAEFSEACRLATGGNPFLLGELLAELRGIGVPPIAAQIHRLTAVAPEGVRRAILVRLARLLDGADALARACAVLGDGADPRVAARLAGIPEGRVAMLVDALVSARIVEPHLALTFVHPLVRAAVTTSMGPAELAAAHRKAATMLAAELGDADVIAAHLLAANPRSDPWVVGLLREAATRATARGAPEMSARYLRRALDEPPAPRDRHGVLFDLGVAEMHAGVPEAIGHLTAAADTARTPVDSCRASLMLARTLFLAGRIADAVEVCERAIEKLAGRAPELAMELEVELVTAATQDALTRPVAVRWHAQRGGDPEPSTRPGCMLLASRAMEEVITLGSRVRAIELAERALSGGRLLEEHGVGTLPSAVLSLTLSGRARRSLLVWDEVIARQRARGDVRGLALASAFRGYAAYYVGDLDAAVADTRLALDLARGQELQQLTEGFAAAWHVYALIDTGDHAAAEQELLAAAPMLAPGASFVGNYLLSARGQLRLAQGRPDEAVADLQECGRRVAA